MSKDVEKGIGFLLGHEEPETKRVRDLYYLDKVKRIIEEPPRVQPSGPTLSEKIPHVSLKTTPSLSPSVNTKEAEGPTRAESKGAYNNFVSNQKTINQLKALRDYHHPKPVGLGNNYKSDIRTPVERKRAEFKAKVKTNKAWIEANKPNADTSKGGYIPWFQRMAQEEAEALNEIKRSTWEQGGRVNPEPKYVNAQDVKNVYEPPQPEASPLQMKNLHKRLENHNEMTGQFKHIPKEEEDPRTEGRMEELQKIEDKGKSWLSKHLKKENKQPTLPGVNWGQSKRII